jgi:phosphoglycerate dehydrogenase-like enzyme
VNLWIPDQPGHEALGELPAGVVCRRFPLQGPLPPALLDAEFLVPSQRAPGLCELLPQMTALRVLQTLSAGVDWLLPSVSPGVRICDASGARDAAVAEWVLAAILSSTKLLGELRDRQRERRWDWSEPGDLAGSTVMILGYGSIGSAVEARLAPFEVDLVRVARRARPGVHAVDELPELLGLADVLVVLLPLTPATNRLLDADLLARLPPGALLVNAARGAILDTSALLELLRSGHLRAALDVTDPEPLPPDHPLWDTPGVLITPHLAGDSPMAERSAFALVGDQVRRYIRGEPLANVVTDGY